MIKLRKAKPADIAGIAAVVRDVWEQNVLPDVCEAQISDATCALWVAADGDDVAGFISAFLTIDGDGTRRWEVDQLAVRRANQGRRLGQKLVERTYRMGGAQNASLARAAVRVDNIASRRTFGHAGFTTDGEEHVLLVWPPDPTPSPSIYGGNVTFIPVDTVTYRGLWLEGLTAESVGTKEQRNAVRTARLIVAREGRLNTGAMIPAGKEHRLAPDLRETANVLGTFYWFIKPLEEYHP